MNEEKINQPLFRFRFGLQQLFYATALIATGLALDPSTIWFSLLVLLGWSVVFFCSSFRLALGLILFALIILFALTPTVYINRDGPHHTSCLNNMKQLSLTLLNYESANGRLPTDRIVVLADGTELRHSWRIEILPFLEANNVFNNYDFNEPWNGPANSKLESPMPWCFACPARNTGTDTPYKLVNGPGTAFEIGKNVRATGLNDGTYNTISLIEDHANPAHWMEPGDFTAEQAAQAMNTMTAETTVHRHESFFKTTYFGSSIAMVDGRTYWWPPHSEKTIAPGAFLIDDGYLFDSQVQGQPRRELK